MKGKKVKFDDDGIICKNDINYLRRNPQCGFIFIQDKPFQPDNHKVFKPVDKDFHIDSINKVLPSVPKIPPRQPIGEPEVKAKDTGDPYDKLYLPQDYTNKYDLLGRRILADTPHGHSVDEIISNKIVNSFNKSGYGILERIGNDTYSHQTQEDRTQVGEIELEDFGAGVGITNNEPPPILRSTRIRPIGDARDTEFNITNLPEEIKDLIVPTKLINITDLSPDVKEYILTKLTGIDNEGETIIDINEMRNEARRLINSEEENAQIRFRNMVLGERLLKTADDLTRRISSKIGLRKILEGQPDRLKIREVLSPTKRRLKPRGMTDEELINTQIEQLSRNLTKNETKQVEKSIRKGKAKVKPIEQEMFPIEPESEELQILKEIDKILKPNETELTIRQKENLVKEMESRGVSRQRVEEVLEMYEAYDPVLEKALGGSSKGTQEERLLRRLRSSIREMPTRDTNLLPERQPSIEIREDTPLTRGRTDIATGRGRVEKAIDKVAGKLPEELRTLTSSVKRNAQLFNENVRTRSLEAVQTIQSKTTRIFGQKYTSIRDTATGFREIGTEMGTISAPEGNINIRPPLTEDITGIRPNDLQAIKLNPLEIEYQETFVGRQKPKLTYAERIESFRTGMGGKIGVVGTGAVGGTLIGFGIADLMNRAGVDNKWAIASTAGAGAGVGARVLTMAGERALTRGAGTAVARSAVYSGIRAGTSLLRGGAEGALLGVVLMPVDEALNHALINEGYSHVGANLLSGNIVGGGATALTTIGLASIGSAPETLGLSLIAGAVAMGVGSIIGAVSGAKQDEAEREAEREVRRINQTNIQRQLLINSLPRYNYDFDKALEGFNNKSKLGMDDDTWSSFSSGSKQLFNPRPNNIPTSSPSSSTPTEEDKKINDLYNQYVTHKLIKRVCQNTTGCGDLEKHDKGDLTTQEYNFLNEKTGGTWESQALLQVETAVHELNYTRQRIAKAQTDMINAWNTDEKVANQLDPYLVQTANLDPTFKQRYDLALKLDAQQKVVDSYQTNQTRIEEMSKNVRDMANIDPEFTEMIHHYYTSIEQTAGQLDISVPQLIQLQNLEGEEQKNKYKEFQFNNIKQQSSIVQEAKEISKEEDQVREAGFYDIDQAFLETDPTAITTWKPSDSQILQAHSAGMTLQEYVNYMHELSKGEAGDFTKLPKYSEDQLRVSGMLDYTHFVDELQLAGYRKDLYIYNPESRQFTLNPNVTNSAIPSTQSNFLSRYTPQYLLKARQEYSDMILGLNQYNQNEIDNFNGNLMRDLTSYGKHYDSIVADINDERLYQGRDDLLFYDVGKIYNKNKLEFNPLSPKLSNAPSVPVLNKDQAMGRQLGEKVSIKEKYVLSDTQYKNVKLNLASKNIKDPDNTQLETAVTEVKSVSNDAPTLAS